MAASDGQVKFMNSLLGQRVVPEALRTLALQRAETDTPKKFSDVIDMLKGCPYPPKPVLAAGWYLVDGTVYRVQKSKGSGNNYAKVLRDGALVYEPGAIFKLPLDAKVVTLQEALAYGLKHNHCIFGGHPLSAAKSVTLAIGPVCAKREFGLTQTQLIKAQQEFNAAHNMEVLV